MQCRGEWVSAETIAEHIMPENPDDASSVLIINTVDSGALSQQDVGLGDGWRAPRGVEVLWGIWPELVDFARDDGSVLGQLVPHIIDIQGESMPVVSPMPWNWHPIVPSRKASKSLPSCDVRHLQWKTRKCFVTPP